VLPREEEQRMEAFNRLFMQQRKGDLVLTGAFVPAERCKDYLMTLAEVDGVLRKRISAADMPSLNELSKALADHFQAGVVRGHRGWCLRPRTTEKAEE
jgi:hypothetical protein